MKKLRIVLATCAGLLMSSTTLHADDAPARPGVVQNIKVLPDKAPDCATLKDIATSITRGCTTDDEKLIAVYNFMILSNYHRAYPPGNPGLEWYTNYGWSLCGGLASLQSSLFSELGWDYRGVSWPGHNMAEAKYNGKWHWFDCFQKFYAWRPDPDSPNGWTIASQDDLAKDPKALLDDAFVVIADKKAYLKGDNLEIVNGKLNWTAPSLLCCGDMMDKGKVVPPTSKRRFGADTAPNAEGWDIKNYSAEVNLTPGLALENTWNQLAPPAESWPIKDKDAVGHTCGNKDLRDNPSAGAVLEPYYNRVRSYSNGRLIYTADLSSPAVLNSFVATDNVKFENGAIVPAKADAPASVTVALDSPYLVVHASGTADGADDIAISTNQGKSFAKADLKDFTSAAKSHMSVYVKVPVKTALKSLQLEEIVMNNAGALPFLSPGKNTVTVSAASPASLGDNKLVVTYAYEPGYRNKSFEEVFATGKHLFAQVECVWAQTPTVVQKIYTAKDLPAKFDIDIATPKDKYPIYPRMLFVRREIVSATGKPLPLPDKAQAPVVNAGDEMKTLPNPFLIGAQPPALVAKAEGAKADAR